MTVGVVVRGELHVGVMQGALIRTRDEFRIDNARVGVQRNVLVQTVVVNTGYHGTLFRHSRFFFDD